ncbi:MAG TPA: MFS transporter [Candidatus Acidoferrales bacterium]|nr:MFS transporter [Candidatus Acidoferrales bacterium]
MKENELAVEEKSLWRNRDYLLLWSGQAISSFGSQASHIILPLLILDITHSAAQAGFVGAFSVIPYVVLSLFAGSFADRFNRKKLMLFCEIGRAIVSGSILLAIFFHSISILQIYLVALFEGIFFVFFDIAEIASIKLIVGNKVSAATAQENATDGFASLFGPSIGTILYQMNRSLPFLLDTVSYIVSFFSLLSIKTEFQEERDDSKPNLLKEIKEGISWLLHHKVLRIMSLLNAGTAFIFSDLILILIILAKEQHATPLEIGTIISISGIGSIIGSVIGSKVKKRVSPGQVVLGSCWVMALLWPLYIFAPNFIFIGLITALLFCINSIWVVVQISYRLSLVPDELQGRVNSVHRFLVYSIIPLGMAMTGVMLQSLGAKTTIFILFFGLLAIAIAGSFSKELRHAPMVRV